MELREINMENWLVSENYQNDLLFIYLIILLQLTLGLKKPLLDEVDDG